MGPRKGLWSFGQTRYKLELNKTEFLQIILSLNDFKTSTSASNRLYSDLKLNFPALVKNENAEIRTGIGTLLYYEIFSGEVFDCFKTSDDVTQTLTIKNRRKRRK